MAAERVAAAFCSCSLRHASADDDDLLFVLAETTKFICDESTHASAKGFCREYLQASIVALMISLLRSSEIPRSSRVIKELLKEVLQIHRMIHALHRPLTQAIVNRNDRRVI
jgi:hypothetical protein